MPEAEKEFRWKPQKPKTHKPDCLCWRCSRPAVAKEGSMPGGNATNRIVPDNKPVELPAGARPYLV